MKVAKPTSSAMEEYGERSLHVQPVSRAIVFAPPAPSQDLHAHPAQ
jgi:hypothetical protein